MEQFLDTEPGLAHDPVFYSEAKEQDGLQFVAGWYFYDETWSWPSGPYATEALARAALAEYVKHL